MTLALTFATPLLLIGLVAAGIPFLLHLLSSIKAQEVYFPTLRFLRMSMEKTARRRRIQHWLLLLLRAGLLALLALAVSEPISEAVGGWLTGRRYAAVLVVDNSLSMSARSGDSNRLARAKAEAGALLGGDDKPAEAALMTTNGGHVSTHLVGELKEFRQHLDAAGIGYGRAPIAQRVSAAVEMLRGTTIPQKSVYVFSDLQRISFEDLPDVKGLVGEGGDVHLLLVDTSGGPARNVGISELEVLGRRIVDEVLEFKVTLVNSSVEAQRADVAFRVDGGDVLYRTRRNLEGAGKKGSIATVTFRHRFARPGTVTGQVFLEGADDLEADNLRRFALNVGGRVGALVVRGPAAGAAALDPAMMLRIALEPYDDKSVPWSISPRIIEAEQFSADSLANVDAVFFCEVPSFTPEQAGAIEQFAAGGGTVMFFLGPEVDAGNYNERFVQQVRAAGGLLPARLEAPVGEVGPAAEALAVEWVDTEHPFFEGLYENRADYLTAIVQRRFRLAASARPGEVLMRLADGEPLLLVKTFGAGRVLLCTTTASPRWSNLSISALFLPMVVRISLLSRQQLGDDPMYLSAAQVAIRPQGLGLSGDAPTDAAVEVTLPADAEDAVPRVVSVPLRKTAEGYLALFTDTAAPGVYTWRMLQAGTDAPPPGGAFVVNPAGLESHLAPIEPDRLRRAMLAAGAPGVYVGTSLADVHAQAAAAAQGRNWWDVLLVAVILLLVVEAAAANRFRRRGEDVIPAHLNPKLAG